jgi:hypothetical protein
MRRLVTAVAVAIASAACAGEAGQELRLETSAGGAPAPSGSAPTVVDSIFPMEVMLARLRAELPEPARLEHGAHTRDALVDRIVTALQAHDTAALEAVAVDRAEFAWLYFPTSPTSRPPYELPPALAWFRIQEGNRKGLLRALRDLGGAPLDLLEYECPTEPRIEGANRIWVGCTVRLARAQGEPVSMRLFESILERDGRFAVLSFANDF